MEVKQAYETSWAGYNDEGMDYGHHMHLHEDGPFIRHDGIRGWYCCAPITQNCMCVDPPPQYLSAISKSEPTLTEAFITAVRKHLGQYNSGMLIDDELVGAILMACNKYSQGRG